MTEGGAIPEGEVDRSPSDAELLERARDGDVVAFFDLWLRHEDFALRAAHGLTRSRYDQEDLVATARDAIWRALSNGRGPKAAFRSYLAVTLKNISTRRYWPGSEPVELVDDPTSAGGQPTDEDFDRLEAGDLLRRAFANLSERHSEVLLLTEVSQLTPQEVGVHLGISPNAASQLAVRARQALRSAWVEAHLARRRSAGTGCAECRELIRRIVAGDATDAELESVEGHIADCEDCRDAYAAAVDAGFTRRALLLAFLGEGADRWFPRQRRLRPRPRRWWWAAAAAGAVASITAAAVLTSADRGGESGTGITATTTDRGPLLPGPRPTTMATSTTSSTTATTATPTTTTTSRRPTLPRGAASTTTTTTGTVAGTTTSTTAPILGPAAGSFARLTVVEGNWGLTSAAASGSWDTSGCSPAQAQTVVVDLAYPLGTVTSRQLLSWTGTGNPVDTVVVNGTPVTAEHLDVVTISSDQLPALTFWQATAEVPRALDDHYAIQGLMTDTTGAYCATGTAYGGVALIGLYEHPALPVRTITLATGLVPLHSSAQTSAWMAPHPGGSAASTFMLSYEGDAEIAGEENVWADGTPLSPTDDIHDSSTAPGFTTRRFTAPAAPRVVEVSSGDDLVLAAALAAIADH